MREPIDGHGSPRINAVSTGHSGGRGERLGWYQKLMNGEIDCDGGSHGYVPRRLIVRAVLAREHPGYVKHES